MLYVCNAVNDGYNVVDTVSGAVNFFKRYALLDLVNRGNAVVLGVDGNRISTFHASNGVFSEQAASYLIRKVMKTILDVKVGATLGLNMCWLDEGIFGFCDKEVWFHSVSCYVPYDMSAIGLDIVLTNPQYLMNTEFAGFVSVVNDNMIHVEIPAEAVIKDDNRLKSVKKLFNFIDKNRKVFLSK